MQIINPTRIPYTAPNLEPRLQNKAPKNAGANCDIMTKATNPIETKL